ncbi:YdcF family protein [Nostoc sp. FACHB-152]|uniref:YdcF family protein n=1 Tax=unclassified Nostoc TaxID=2593658 RepID=UPI001688F926|nr:MULTISPECIES: YdcF family protein [unclassified Nostoc]MBD2451099.1 YdcF family protein [Nostoc sp. FACHB-152]MBD2472458.1 YdcF family protein [Nostoc sp. FACHB-145]
MAKLHRQIKKYLILVLASCFLTLLLSIPVRLAITSQQAPQPQAILMLGGLTGEREKFTAQFAQYYPNLEIWISSSINPQKVRAIFQAAGIPESRLNLDYSAVDTVTNFTTLVDKFQQRQIQHLYLITSDFHMHRARAIATIVLGSRGIIFTPLTVPSNAPQEPILSIIRDIVRSLLWVFTGYTGR